MVNADSADLPMFRIRFGCMTSGGAKYYNFLVQAATMREAGKKVRAVVAILDGGRDNSWRWFKSGRVTGPLPGFAASEDLGKPMLVSVDDGSTTRHASGPAPLAQAVSGEPAATIAARKPWIVMVDYHPAVGRLFLRVASHFRATVAFSDAAAAYCGGSVEFDADGYATRCRVEDHVVAAAREIARTSVVLEALSRRGYARKTQGDPLGTMPP